MKRDRFVMLAVVLGILGGIYGSWQRLEPHWIRWPLGIAIAAATVATTFYILH